MLPAAMLFALSTTNKLVIACMGGAFIAFSLISAMVIPRTKPEFPGRNLRVYLAVCVAMFLAMLAAILIFAKEKKEPAEAVGEPAGKIEANTGDAAAGKIVFDANGCGGCHRFAPAASTGNVGPDLDKLPEAASAAGQELDAFTRESILDPDAVIAEGFTKGVMPAAIGASLSEVQLNDLVAFLTQGGEGATP
jgi:cytochrome c551/c552